ncbi:hypothetical protein GCM10010212_33200 [Paenarthrobacter nicotinovorans]|nr:hypothetical protein NtRootA2_42470 [Arthrobacter sp. NtRootA2]BCW33843.1 hypothetical protein NtRootD5_41740 [Arthrobacter sp. NtRootD5]GGV41578.1 hypothetical protein GCM10010212_33200 [Paenarthrobacter nicotinovorans]
MGHKPATKLEHQTVRALWMGAAAFETQRRCPCEKAWPGAKGHPATCGFPDHRPQASRPGR